MHPTAAPSPVLLSRTVRAGIFREAPAATAARNGFAGIPAAHGLAAHHEFTLVFTGLPDESSSYLVGIQEIDALARTHLIPWLQGVAAAPEALPSDESTIASLGRLAMQHAPDGATLVRITWSPSPFVQHQWSPRMPKMATLVEHFEFSASHRLHSPALSEAENQRLFGKCNHPNGHGHNYRVAVAVLLPVDAPAPRFGVGELSAIVEREVLARLDHRHLNLDCPEFAARNPSVENIAFVCHGYLDAPLRRAGAELSSVTVWETEKTSATYPADAMR